ncbi:OmpA family protein [Larkinella sp. C7]|jgi:outer membrane protein OmpA-like peptidoglycan-associated protein/Tol biopolymer transport system component|uniref:OmpA family protein n=1 Tax=Larkinella sp. C7 TaxID=2576607 RepID=UPI0011112BEF|nr:OmpA family protein [Larkinella sp. C7]
MAGFVANTQIHGHSVKEPKWVKGRRERRPNRLFLLLFLFSFPPFLLPSYCQNKKAVELYKKAVDALSNRKMTESLDLFHQAVERDTGYTDAYLKLGQVYEFMRQPDQAFQVYQRAIGQQPDKPTTGLAYQFVSAYLLKKGNYRVAIPHIERYQKLFPPQSLQWKRIDRMLQTAHFGEQAIQNPLPVKPQPLSPTVQAFPSQYFPVLTADEQTLVYTVLKPEGDEDLMVSTQKGETWSPPESISPLINSINNEGTPTLSADGRTLVFTVCQGRAGYGSCDLYISHKTGNAWSEPQNIGPVVNTRAWESQPALSADGRRLYFVSDRKGGVGRRDIWCSDLGDDGEWKPPYNLKSINTPFDEASPFIHANGLSLFFASEGHLGLGGYDLFVADSTASGWSNPQNLGYPINTSDDQAALFVSANGAHAYYSQEQAASDGKQRSKLYVFDLPEALRQKVRPVSYLKGLVADARTKKPLNATIELIDLSTNQLITRVQSDPQTGQYTAILPTGGEYALYVIGPGYLFKSLSFDFTRKREGEGLTMSVPLEPIKPTEGEAPAKETLNNLFFETGRYDLADKSRTELDRLVKFLEVNPTVNIEVSGHTDNQGGTANNLELSKKRAQSVVSYLAKAGVAPNRIKSAGYGETKPVAPNTTDENRKLNRRIEWRIL